MTTMHALNPAQRRALAAVARITLVAAPMTQAACNLDAPSTATALDASGDATGDGSAAPADASRDAYDAFAVDAFDDADSATEGGLAADDGDTSSTDALSDGGEAGETGIDYEPNDATVVTGRCGTFAPVDPSPEALSCCADLAESKVAAPDASDWVRIDPNDPVQVACCYVVTVGVLNHTISLALTDAGPSIQYAALSNCCAIFDPPPDNGACLSWGPPMPLPMHPALDAQHVA